MKPFFYTMNKLHKDVHYGIRVERLDRLPFTEMKYSDHVCVHQALKSKIEMVYKGKQVPHIEALTVNGNMLGEFDKKAKEREEELKINGYL